MNGKDFRHIRQSARRHHEEHLKLKDLLSKPLYRERVLGAFVATFFISLGSLILFSHWGDIVGFFSPTQNQRTEDGEWSTRGYQSGALGNYRVADQAEDTYEKLLASIGTRGFMSGAQASGNLGKGKRVEGVTEGQKGFLASVYTTKTLSSGQHLTELRQNQAKGLQKSLLSTFHLGEGSGDRQSELSVDTKLLSQISNTLSVDLFQYLNQSNSRADSLDSYLNLLSTLLKRTNERMTDLQAKINFLRLNSNAREERITISEQTFFNSINIFNGANAEEELGRFIGLQSGQTEIKAKMGAYQALYDYYAFFKPRIENLILSIRANRDALVAGVKVVEIENMTLPLVIRQH